MGWLKWFWCVAFLVASAPAPLLRFSSGGTSSDQPLAEAIRANDNQVAAGTLRKHVLQLVLEARAGIWHPDGDAAPGVTMQAFAEAGAAPQISGPMIRVPQGAEIRITIHNQIDAPLIVHGLHTHPLPAGDALEIPALGTRQVSFPAGLPGTYFYWGTTTGKSIEQRYGQDSQLSGAFIVDPPGTKGKVNDRIFMIGNWLNIFTPDGQPINALSLAVINGRSWPHTERLTYSVGEAVHWRWINASYDHHPLHLHGFFFTVESRSNSKGEIAKDDLQRHREVTDLIDPGQTLTMTWRPDRAGNWLFHCHNVDHFRPHTPLEDIAAGRQPPQLPPPGHGNHAEAGMSGMVLGVTVRPQKQKSTHSPETIFKHLQLIAHEDGGTAARPGFAYDLVDANGVKHSGSGLPSPTMVLTQGVPVSILVTNQMKEPTAVHWHGIELESYYDGVADFSGDASHTAPAIEPERSFEVRLTPPRAGTFIYHTHMNDVQQLEGGLAGALLVLEPGQSLDPSTDHVVLITSGREDMGQVLVNGRVSPQPVEIQSGVTQRLRLINITRFRVPTVILRSDTEVLKWIPQAKDGADLPLEARTERLAQQKIGMGETYDFEFTPSRAGELSLDVVSVAGKRMSGLRFQVNAVSGTH
jgi:FtsP/CotA-like multicopper oxidase with cupredoxin domain